MSDLPANHHPQAPNPLALSRPSLSDRVRSLRLPDRAPAPRSGPAWLPWTLCGFLAVGLAYLYTRSPAETKPVPKDEEKSAADTGPEVPQRPAADGDVVLESKGWILATHQYKVGPNQVGSKVIYLHPDFLEGKLIREGELLARLDDTEYRTKYDQARGDYESAQHEVNAAEERLRVATYNRAEEIKQTEAELEESKATLEKLKLDLERNNALKTGGALARRDYEESKFGTEAQEHRVRMLSLKYKIMKDGPRREVKDEAEANLKKARANLERAEGAMKEAKWRLDNCRIFAPVSGTILKKNVELYDPLDARAFNLASILCEMADLTDLEVELNVQERDIARVHIGQPCRIVPESHPERGFRGTVYRMMPTADRAKGAIPVRVKVDRKEIPPRDAGKYLSPDGAAIVTIYNKKAPGKLAPPPAR